MHKHTGKIRDIINRPTQKFNLLKDLAVHSQLCSSLDTIEDSDLAIEAYVNKSTKDTGNQYLRLYGVLQALILQQDAVKHLSESVTDAVT